MGSPAAASRMGDRSWTPSLLYSKRVPRAQERGRSRTAFFWAWAPPTLPSSLVERRFNPELWVRRWRNVTRALSPSLHEGRYRETGVSRLGIRPSWMSMPTSRLVTDFVLDMAYIGRRNPGPSYPETTVSRETIKQAPAPLFSQSDSCSRTASALIPRDAGFARGQDPPAFPDDVAPLAA